MYGNISSLCTDSEQMCLLYMLVCDASMPFLHNLNTLLATMIGLLYILTIPPSTTFQQFDSSKTHDIYLSLSTQYHVVLL